ncbi:MAG: MarR family winged helix-turn-helix transcriptional regulator [Candidatus Kapaibacterium sp.]
MALKDRLKQQKFTSAQQEAVVGILSCADIINRRMDELVAPFEITLPQYNVLRILRGVHPDGHPRGEITSRMIQQAPDVTRLIDRLERQGLVIRGKSPDDGRLSMSFITQKGLSLLSELDPILRRFDRQLRAALPDEDATRIATIIDRLVDGLG